MTVEHEEVGEILAKMREVTNDYTLPAEACPSFTALYHRLRAFERDLHQHIHLENNLLFPRAIDLELKARA
jgi:regulator of cell morphogenesis and NO signaling